MKKLLLMTTAVAGLAFAPTAAQAEIDLDLGGYFKGYAGFTDQDVTGIDDFGTRRESEIHVNGETTLDSGLTVGARFEIQTEADAAGNDTEEAYVYFSGNWGRINFGAEDGAAYLLQVAAPSADSNIDGIDPDINFINTNGTFTTPTTYELAPTQDADKITYLTPKFAGFQAGVSYATDSIQDGLGSGLLGQSADESASPAGTLHEVVEAAVRYDAEVSGVGVHVGGGFVTADHATATTATDNFDAFNVGVKLDIGAFGVGVAYTEFDNFTGANEESEVIVVGADYVTGPYKFGASWFNSSTDDFQAANSDEELENFTVGAGYTFGPGMSFRGTVQVSEAESSVGAANENDAVAFILGTDIQF